MQKLSLAVVDYPSFRMEVAGLGLKLMFQLLVSKVLMGVKTRYLKIDKLAYALLIATGKLCHYFQAYPIVVLTD